MRNARFPLPSPINTPRGWNARTPGHRVSAALPCYRAEPSAPITAAHLTFGRGLHGSSSTGRPQPQALEWTGMKPPSFAGSLALWLVTACPALCARGVTLPCCADDACADMKSPAPDGPCLCSGGWLPPSGLSIAQPVPKPDAWVHPADLSEALRPNLPMVVHDPAWTTDPPAERGVLPLLI